MAIPPKAKATATKQVSKPITPPATSAKPTAKPAAKPAATSKPPAASKPTQANPALSVGTKPAYSFNVPALMQIGEATLQEPGYTFADPELLAPMQAHTPVLVEVNLENLDEHGHVACRLLPAGMEIYQALLAAQPASAPQKSMFANSPSAVQLDVLPDLDSDVGADDIDDDGEMYGDESDESDDGGSEYEIENDVPMIARRNDGGGRKSLYPFDKLKVGQSFFIPATDDCPNPAKSKAGTVSAATRRYAVLTGETRINKAGNEKPATRKTRRFTIMPSTRVLSDGTEQFGARVWRKA